MNGLIKKFMEITDIGVYVFGSGAFGDIANSPSHSLIHLFKVGWRTCSDVRLVPTETVSMVAVERKNEFTWTRAKSPSPAATHKFC